MSSFPALRAAIDLHQIPSRVQYARTAPLPVEMNDILRVLSGDGDMIATAARELERPAEEIVAASKFFVEQVMMAPDADHYRVLGATMGADTNELRQNMALLMRWLHPDTGSATLRSVFAHRVTEAWDHMKTAERRAAYDATLPQDLRAAKPAEARPPAPPVATNPSEDWRDADWAVVEKRAAIRDRGPSLPDAGSKSNKISRNRSQNLAGARNRGLLFQLFGWWSR